MSNIVEIRDLSEVDNSAVSFIILYQSNCGTCDIAKKMISIVAETIIDINYYQLNFTGKGDLVLKYKIKSIPYFLVIKNGEVVESFAAFNSVTYIYELLSKYM